MADEVYEWPATLHRDGQPDEAVIVVLRRSVPPVEVGALPDGTPPATRPGPPILRPEGFRWPDGTPVDLISGDRVAIDWARVAAEPGRMPPEPTR